jgi:hypothetical protein
MRFKNVPEYEIDFYAIVNYMILDEVLEDDDDIEEVRRAVKIVESFMSQLEELQYDNENRG